jgi:RHS repeat-associated protein
MENESGDGLDLAWDEHSRLKGIRQKREKRTLVLAYDAMGRIHSVSFRFTDGRLQELAEYGYDTLGRLVSAKDPLGRTERYEYDSSGRLVRELAVDGGIASFKYDDKGRCIRFGGLDGYNLKMIRYLDHIQMSEVTNSLGKTTRHQWLASGQVKTLIDPLGATTETEFDDFGRIVSKTSPLGAVTRYEYDPEGNRKKIVDALGQESIFEYGPRHLPLGYTDPSGRKWTRKYDNAYRLTAFSDPSGAERQIGYDVLGNPVRITRADGAFRTQRFNAEGNLEATTDWLGSVTRFERDAFGRTVSREDPDGSIFRYEYDLLGRVARMAGPGGKGARFAYDAGGNLSRTERSGENPVSYTFGPCHRLLSRTDANGNTLRFAWGSEPDRLETVLNESGEKYTFGYDSADRVIQETGFDGRIIQFKYDPDGRCIEKSMGPGLKVLFRHDALGRMVEERPDGDEPALFQYDPSGSLISAANEWCELKFERDLQGRVVRETQNGYALSRKFGTSGTIEEILAEDGTAFRYGYDGNGLATSIDANGLGVFHFERNALGIETERVLPGEISLRNEYDSRRRLIRQAVSSSKGGGTGQDSILTRMYAYGDSDRLESIDDSQWGKSRYAHDPDGRLLRFATDEFQTDYSSNKTGDIVHVRSTGIPDLALEYSPGGRLLSRGTEKNAFDHYGRLISKTREGETGSWIYEWDAKNRLRSVSAPDGKKWDYRYDPLGRRISKHGPEGTIRYIWDQDVLFQEIDDTGRATSWGFDPHSFKPLFKIASGGVYSVLHDHLGTPREMLDARGTVVWSLRLDPWGNAIACKGKLEDCPFRFQGQYFDSESGLHYNRFRYYDPSGFRFISPDPARLLGGASAYQYVKNPLHWIDPFGLCPADDEKPAETVFRGERSSNDPDKVFEQGLQSKGDNMDLLRHTSGNQSDTGYISTSQDKGIAEGFAGKNGYVYEIETNKGINANETLGAASPFPEQKEVSVPRQIPPSDIKGAYPMKGGKPTGEFIPNPNFGGGS